MFSILDVFTFFVKYTEVRSGITFSVLMTTS